MFNKKSILITLCLSLSQVVLAVGTKGGGDPREVEFIAAAEDLSKKLPNIGPQYKEIAEKFSSAVASTNVICASGAHLDMLVKENQMAYYFNEENTIRLHCDRWEKEKKTDGALMMIAHEYFRVLGIEGKEYKHSKRIVSALRTLGKSKPEYGQFLNYEQLLQKFNQSLKVNDAATLGMVASFVCNVVTYENQVSTVVYSFFKIAGSGVYKHYRDYSYCNRVGCQANESQMFIIDQNSQLRSNSSLISHSYLNGTELIDSDEVVFRQTAEGNLIGMGIRTSFALIGEGKKKIQKMISCQRESLTTE
ncbi:MAG: hypothetical protein AABY64_03285 [Bdellovibrionota bacterium]